MNTGFWNIPEMCGSNLHISIKESPHCLEENFQLCQKKVSFKCCCHNGSAEPGELEREETLCSDPIAEAREGHSALLKGLQCRDGDFY